MSYQDNFERFKTQFQVFVNADVYDQFKNYLYNRGAATSTRDGENYITTIRSLLFEKMMIDIMKQDVCNWKDLL